MDGFPKALLRRIRMAMMPLFLFIALGTPALAQDQSEAFLDITSEEAENFRSALEYDGAFEVEDFNQKANGDRIITSFSILGKDFRIISLNDDGDYRRELRKTFSSEIGSLAGSSQAYVFNRYKTSIAAKGDLRVSDLVSLKSIDGKVGMYIVNQAGDFKETAEGGSESAGPIFLLKPLKGVSVFTNARLMKRRSSLMLDACYSLFFSGQLGHALGIRVKTVRTHPVWLSLGLEYRFRPGAENSIGARLGAESFISIDAAYDIQSGVGIFAGCGLAVMRDLLNSRMVYAPDVEVGIRWFFLSRHAVSLAARFTDEFTERFEGSVSGSIFTCLSVGYELVL